VKEQDEQKTLILNRAYELFQRYGVVRITMDLIASKCGVSKKTIYKHFKNKDDLLHQVVVIKAHELQDELINYSKEHTNALLSIRAFFERSYNIFTNLFPNFIRDIKQYYPHIFQQILSINKKLMLSFIKENIGQGKQEGMYRDDLDINKLSVSFNNALTVLLSEDLPFNSENSIHPIVFLNQLFIYRLLSVSGLEKLESIYPGHVSENY